MTTPAYRSTATWIEQVLASLAEAVEQMDDGAFLDEHQRAHDEPRSATVDIVAATLEREYWRRFPMGRNDA